MQSSFVWKQGSGKNGPNIFSSFANAVAACNTLQGAPCEIRIDGSLVSGNPVIPAGTYVGIDAIELITTDDGTTITISDGVTFDALPRSIVNGLYVQENASVGPLVTLTAGPFGSSIRTCVLDNAVLNIPLLELTAGNVLLVCRQAALAKAGTVTVDAAGNLQVALIDSDLLSGAITGAGTAFVGYDSGSLLQPQSVTSFSSLMWSKANSVAYSPAAPSNWAGTAPATDAQAIDRLAVAVAGLLGGPIP